MEYSHALGMGDDPVSEWAPFSSRTEWELARWAKLRGPSSTALSELLDIDGVSQRLHRLQHSHTDSLFRLFKTLDFRFRVQRNSTALLTKSSRMGFLSLSGKKSQLRVKNMSSIIGISSSVSACFMGIQISHSFWSMRQRNTTLLQTRRAGYILRCTPANGGGAFRWVLFPTVKTPPPNVNQEELEKKFPGATILPILISSDKTRVVMFGTNQHTQST